MMGMFITYVLTLLFLYVYYGWVETKHRKEIAEIHAKYADERKVMAEERQELLDRIMANNFQEFRASKGNPTVKRSTNGNYLLDRMAPNKINDEM